MKKFILTLIIGISIAGCDFSQDALLGRSSSSSYFKTTTDSSSISSTYPDSSCGNRITLPVTQTVHFASCEDTERSLWGAKAQAGGNIIISFKQFGDKSFPTVSNLKFLSLKDAKKTTASGNASTDSYHSTSPDAWYSGPVLNFTCGSPEPFYQLTTADVKCTPQTDLQKVTVSDHQINADDQEYSILSVTFSHDCGTSDTYTRSECFESENIINFITIPSVWVHGTPTSTIPSPVPSPSPSITPTPNPSATATPTPAPTGAAGIANPSPSPVPHTAGGEQ